MTQTPVCYFPSKWYSYLLSQALLSESIHWQVKDINSHNANLIIQPRPIVTLSGPPILLQHLKFLPEIFMQMKLYRPQISFPHLANLNSSLKLNDLPVSAKPLLPNWTSRFYALTTLCLLVTLSASKFPSPNLL